MLFIQDFDAGVNNIVMGYRDLEADLQITKLLRCEFDLTGSGCDLMWCFVKTVMNFNVLMSWVVGMLSGVGIYDAKMVK